MEGPADAGQSVRAEIFRINSCGDCVFQNSYLNPFSPRKCQTSRALSNDEKSASLSSPRGNFFRLFFLSVKVSIVHPSNLVPFPPFIFPSSNRFISIRKTFAVSRLALRTRTDCFYFHSNFYSISTATVVVGSSGERTPYRVPVASLRSKNFRVYARRATSLAVLTY